MSVSPLKISNIKKSFGSKVVLNDINLEIKNNEIFGLIGLNGAGKTTLIKIILDLLDSDKGTTEILGISSTQTKSREKLRYLPEKFQVSSMLKGVEFLKIFNSFNKNTENYNLEEKISKLANLLDLDKKALTMKVSKYSKGMMQKLGLISTFLGDSELVILDEPMSGLDPKARINLKELLLDSKSKNRSIFFSSHILSDIDEICDRIAILNNTKIVFIGTPNELKNKHSQTSLEKAFLKEIE
ncbi:MAG TPA: ABC transporter ATP-binding protein [Rickettsiales bacterium]|nr:ABC transporter ATP-binding protein [Rickettsiales bacterium]